MNTQAIDTLEAQLKKGLTMQRKITKELMNLAEMLQPNGGPVKVPLTETSNAALSVARRNGETLLESTTSTLKYFARSNSRLIQAVQSRDVGRWTEACSEAGSDCIATAQMNAQATQAVAARSAMLCFERESGGAAAATGTPVRQAGAKTKGRKTRTPRAAAKTKKPARKPASRRKRT
jgi:hypothetical protein